jgi:hypothetical protein
MGKTETALRTALLTAVYRPDLRPRSRHPAGAVLMIVRSVGSWRLHGRSPRLRARAEIDLERRLGLLEIDVDGISATWRPQRDHWLGTIETPDRRFDHLAPSLDLVLLDEPDPFFDALLLRTLRLVPDEIVRVSALILSAKLQLSRRDVVATCLGAANVLTGVGPLRAFRYVIDGEELWADASGLPLRREGWYEISKLEPANA